VILDFSARCTPPRSVRRSSPSRRTKSERLLEELPLEPLTSLSITDREAFRAEIEKVRRQGYAVMDEENELGMRAVAVPVFNSQGTAFASLATAVPVFRLSMEALVALVPLLQAAAAELSARLPQR
jgi:DNA-binding IclR family transcriptional regulator